MQNQIRTNSYGSGSRRPRNIRKTEFHLHRGNGCSNRRTLLGLTKSGSGSSTIFTILTSYLVEPEKPRILIFLLLDGTIRMRNRIRTNNYRSLRHRNIWNTCFSPKNRGNGSSNRSKARNKIWSSNNLDNQASI